MKFPSNMRTELKSEKLVQNERDWIFSFYFSASDAHYEGARISNVTTTITEPRVIFAREPSMKTINARTTEQTKTRTIRSQVKYFLLWKTCKRHFRGWRKFSTRSQVRFVKKNPKNLKEKMFLATIWNYMGESIIFLLVLSFAVRFRGTSAVSLVSDKR